MTDCIFESGTSNDAERKLYNIVNLCRVGVASSDTAMNVDLTKGGHCELYEAIAALASDAIDQLETGDTKGQN